MLTGRKTPTPNLNHIHVLLESISQYNHMDHCVVLLATHFCMHIYVLFSVKSLEWSQAWQDAGIAAAAAAAITVIILLPVYAVIDKFSR